MNGIGEVYKNQGRYREALDSFQVSLAIAREVGDRTGVGTTLYNIGSAHRQQRNLEQALSFYEQAMEVLEEVRLDAGSEAGRAGFIAQFSGLYADAVEAYHRQGHDAEAFVTSERGRARAFLDSLTSGRVTLRDDESAGLLARERASYAARRSLQDALAQARSPIQPDGALITDLEARLEAAEQEYASSLTAIEARKDQLASLVPSQFTVLSLPRVQALLDGRTTLVSYYVLGDEGTLAFVITHEGFTVVELPEATGERLSAEVWSLESNLLDSRNDAHPSQLQTLRDWLIDPLVDHLHTPLVGIVPHQKLHYVPFAALTDGETYFGQQHTIFVLPSASSLPLIRDNAAEEPGSGALIFGNPATDEPGLESLVHAGEEARSVAKLRGLSSYIEAEASEARLRAEVSGAGTLHLAAHAEYNAANPLYSVIYLTPGTLRGEPSDAEMYDGRLEVHEVYGLDLSASDLVVLSACETHAGALSTGDEVVGLTRAFHFAGAPTVVSTLWVVDDAATEALAVAFHRQLAAGLGKAEALQAAQTEVRANPRWRAPFYWSGFVLSGDPGPWTGRAGITGPGLELPAADAREAVGHTAPLPQVVDGDRAKTPAGGGPAEGAGSSGSGGTAPWLIGAVGAGVGMLLLAGLGIWRRRRVLSG